MGTIQERRTDLVRKISLILLGSALAATLSGCKTQADSSKPGASSATQAAAPSTPRTNEAAANSTRPESDQTVDSIKQEEAPEYMGEWKVLRQLPTSISGLSDEEAEEYIGQILSLEKDLSEFNGDRLKNPVYVVQNLNKEDYEEKNRVSLASWGLKGDSIQRVRVYEDQAKTKDWDSYAGLADWIDGHLVISIEGQYFELAREETASLPLLLDQTDLKEGDQCSSLTVRELEKNEDGSLARVSFSGEIMVEGSYEVNTDEGDPAYTLTLDDSYKDKLPVMDRTMISDPIIISIPANRTHPKDGQKGRARMTIRGYTVALAQMSRTAELVKMEDTES